MTDENTTPGAGTDSAPAAEPAPPKRARKKGNASLLTTPEACEFLTIGRTTLYVLGNLGRIPKIKVKGQVRWRRADLERYLEQQTRVGRRRPK